MNRLQKKEKPVISSCQACHKQIPISAALTAEGRDYSYYFCGTDCFEKWRKQQEKN